MTKCFDVITIAGSIAIFIMAALSCGCSKTKDKEGVAEMHAKSSDDRKQGIDIKNSYYEKRRNS